MLNPEISKYCAHIDSQVDLLIEQELDPFAEKSRETLVAEKIRDCLREIPEAQLSRVSAEFSGWGPLEEILTDTSITEILINGEDSIWIERMGQLSQVKDAFSSSRSYQRFLNRLCDEAQVHLTIEHPFAQGRWRDFRIQIVGKEIARTQTLVSLRRHPVCSWTLQKIRDQGACTDEQLKILQLLIRGHSNLLIAGPTGCGKTSMMNALLQEASPTERSVVIEDTEEIHLPGSCSVRLLTRKDPAQLLPQIDQSELLRHALRLRPDRMIVGEIRGPEAKDLIMALSTGHRGSMSTLHAATAHQALLRLEMLVQLGAPHWNLHAVRRMIALGVDYILILDRDISGRRRVNGIFKLVSLEEFGFLIEPASLEHLES